MNYIITNGTSVLVDGAKRDRLVWPGDMAIALPSIFVFTNDLVTVQNSLDSLLRQKTPQLEPLRTQERRSGSCCLYSASHITSSPLLASMTITYTLDVKHTCQQLASIEMGAQLLE